ncbi:hypothetical protein [Rhizobium sp. MHM7A]|uniref:hypothetical protein n=1 Tax=Rhizobium sp. MHM7A TaxID=2583233 RepID=UPI00110734C5|nr:hypothetical protein [Rhizobium sp. MHM7A]TLX17182.1 hypothetical protein FFR93_07685 [Rhizobium sp. MHM7A]
METVTLLQERIRSAKSNASSIIDASNLDRLLAQLVEQPVVKDGTAEEIFPSDDRKDEAGFLFRQVSGRQQVAALTEIFKAQAGSKERWPFDIWLDRAFDHHSTIIEVKREGDELPAGFAVIATRLEVEGKTDADSQSTIALRVDLNSVYVTSERRGEGHSQALSWAIGKQVDRILYALAEAPASSRQSFKEHKVEIFIEGEAHSEGGANFLAGTVEQIESNMDFINLEKAWFDVPAVMDDVDYDKFARLAELRR